MWNYEKRLQYPVHIKTPNAKIAKIILTQYGGPYTRNLERLFYLFKCERDLIKKMIQYFSPGGNRGVFYRRKAPRRMLYTCLFFGSTASERMLWVWF